MTNPYKIRCSLVGHNKDVRCLTTISETTEAFVSGSRDVTCKLWRCDENAIEFTETLGFGGHKSFVSALCFQPPSHEYPLGLIYSGGNDAIINAYTLDSPTPIFTLTGHDNNVCTLECSPSGLVISGSWDKMAKLWKDRKCIATLKGHETAIWAVLLVESKSLIITGAADRSIRMWSMDGQQKSCLTGHTDCVRGLALLSDTQFVSCANDATIRLWNIDSGQCLREYFGHTNFVYSIARLPCGSGFVSCGEDRTLRVWQVDSPECLQTIFHPATSVWCTCVLQNGDIVTGASDSNIRVFSSNALRQAPTDVQKAFEDEVATSSISSEIGDIQKDKLPGPSALQTKGTKEGQVLLINENNSVQCYQWSVGESRWIKVGDVVGSAGSTQQTSGKTLYEGKEYDFVFVVDIAEGQAPLKLPFNRGEDPWMAAQTFIHKHDLSQVFLDQVANFIVQNVPDLTSAPGQTGPTFVDPFTGAGRYVPGSETSPSRPQQASSDPFTGGGRYVPDGGVKSGEHPTKNSTSDSGFYFPTKSYLVFDTMQSGPLFTKLSQFNVSVEAPLSPDCLDLIKRVTELKESEESSLINGILRVITKWPIDKVFPLIDIIRYLVRREPSNANFCSEASNLMTILSVADGSSTPAPNRMLCLRLLANLFHGPKGSAHLVTKADSLLAILERMEVHNVKSLQVPAASFLLNLVIAVVYSHPSDVLQSSCLHQCTSLLGHQALDVEACFRLLVALGTLITAGNTSLLLHDPANFQTISQLRDAVARVAGCDDYSMKTIESAVMLLSLL